MVRALIRETGIEGTGKTMTRRLVRPQPLLVAQHHGEMPAYQQRSRRTVSSGDRIWVREAWGTDAPDLDACRQGVDSDGRYCGPCFRADDDAGCPPYGGWRSPIHMPRWASRLTLIVTDVRIERLGAITEDDARREGVSRWRWRPTARTAFIDLWDELHGPGAWDRDRDRWVQVIAFTPRLENIDALDEGAAA